MLIEKGLSQVSISLIKVKFFSILLTLLKEVWHKHCDRIEVRSPFLQLFHLFSLFHCGIYMFCKDLVCSELL
jgi:hypothetical protein